MSRWDGIVGRLKHALEQPFTGKCRHTPVSVDRIALSMLIKQFEATERAIRNKIWNKIKRIEFHAAKEVDAPKLGDTKFFVVWSNEKMDFVWHEKSNVQRFDGGFLIKEAWEWELQSSGLTVVREDGEAGELLRPYRLSRV